MPQIGEITCAANTGTCAIKATKGDTFAPLQILPLGIYYAEITNSVCGSLPAPQRIRCKTGAESTSNEDVIKSRCIWIFAGSETLSRMRPSESREARIDNLPRPILSFRPSAVVQAHA